jgi:hypothetical protein
MQTWAHRAVEGASNSPAAAMDTLVVDGMDNMSGPWGKKASLNVRQRPVLSKVRTGLLQTSP